MNMLSGPMFEQKESEYWVSLLQKDGAHYNIFSINRDSLAMEALREMFPDGKADDLNFVLFSTSGVHGTYKTIESSEGDKSEYADITFLIVHPRIVALRYGNVIPENQDDYNFLKKLRASSWEAIQRIGKHEIGERSGKESGGNKS